MWKQVPIRREDVEGEGATAGTMVGGCKKVPKERHREFGRGHQYDGEPGYKLQKAKKSATKVNRGGGLGIRA